MKIKKEDQVLIISGKDKGKKGKVLQVWPASGKLTVENMNLVKKHRRARRQGEKGQIVAVPHPLPAAKVKLICPKCGQASRVGFKLTPGGKFRICKKCQQEI
ncbi:MAG: 50S ribosomal protein L24 [Candidatus Portnoybacteria bacterium]|nr:50S ribosomal protein L24 [Candidatus Portnoybacteria bacterium]